MRKKLTPLCPIFTISTSTSHLIVLTVSRRCLLWVLNGTLPGILKCCHPLKPINLTRTNPTAIPTQLPPELERVITENELIDDHALTEISEYQNIMRWNNMKDDLETIIRKHVTPVPTSLQGPLDKFPKQRQLYSKVISVNEEALLRIGTHEQDMDVSQNVWKDYMSSTVLNTPLGKIQEFIVTSKVHDGDTGAITTLKTFGEGELSAIAAAVRRICERAPVEVDQLDYNLSLIHI